jgi:hypothetical protein
VNATVAIAARLLAGPPRGQRAARWAAGIAIAIVLAPVILTIAVLCVVSNLLGAATQSALQPGAGSPIPPAFVEVFNDASQTLDVNPYLLASVADQESGFGTAAGWTTVNDAGCVGFMQTCVGGRAGDSWDSTVTLTTQPAVTIAERFAYRLAPRPAGYPLQTTGHPSYDDPFDAVMAAAVELRGKVDGAPIPALNDTAYQALCGYYGACADPTVNYASDVLARARAWQAEDALINAGGGPVALSVPTGPEFAPPLPVPHREPGARRLTAPNSPATRNWDLTARARSAGC